MLFRSAAGAYVAYPKEGIQDWVGSLDINSLYPSAIRALNMGPETIIGQLRPVMTDRYIAEKIRSGNSFAAAWEGLFATLEYTAVMEMQTGTEITIDWQDGEESVHSAAEVWHIIFDSNRPWMLSANGTIFTYEKEGVIPGLLKRWYAERKEMQAKLKEATTKDDEEYWDKRQLVKKINLNSLYGAILNPGCRFFDKRIGQSTTLTGRSIARHMDAYVNECITGHYDHVGEAIIYGDTDSCYFTAYPILQKEIEAGNMTWSREIAVQLYNSIADQVNESFPGFMEQAFHVPREMGSVIRGGREIVASKGLFITKKRYVGNLYEKNPDKYYQKSMGIVLKRRDNAPVVKIVCGNIIDQILNKRSSEGAVKMTQFLLNKIITGQMPLDKFIITKTLKFSYKDRTRIVHAVLADRMAERDPGNKPESNDRIPYVYYEVENEKNIQLQIGRAHV